MQVLKGENKSNIAILIRAVSIRAVSIRAISIRAVSIRAVSIRAVSIRAVSRMLCYLCSFIDGCTKDSVRECVSVVFCIRC